MYIRSLDSNFRVYIIKLLKPKGLLITFLRKIDLNSEIQGGLGSLEGQGGLEGPRVCQDPRGPGGLGGSGGPAGPVAPAGPLGPVTPVARNGRYGRSKRS